MCYEDFAPVANWLIEKIGNDLVRNEKSDRVRVRGAGGFVIDDGESVKNG